MIIKIYKTTGKSRTNNEILEQEKLGNIGASSVLSQSICEIELHCGCTYCSLLVSREVYDVIKNDSEFIIESEGFWNSFYNPNVTVKRVNGEILKPLKLF